MSTTASETPRLSNPPLRGGNAADRHTAPPTLTPLLPRARRSHVVLPNGGYGALLDILAGGLHVRFKSSVRAIEVDPDGEGVTVKMPSCVLRADAVVCSVPLGILQRPLNQGGIAFSPPLIRQEEAAQCTTQRAPSGWAEHEATLDCRGGNKTSQRHRLVPSTPCDTPTVASTAEVSTNVRSAPRFEWHCRRPKGNGMSEPV